MTEEFELYNYIRKGVSMYTPHLSVAESRKDTDTDLFGLRYSEMTSKIVRFKLDLE